MSKLVEEFILLNPNIKIPNKFKKYTDQQLHKQLHLNKIVINPNNPITPAKTIVLPHRNRFYYFDHPDLSNRLDEKSKIILDYINLVPLPEDPEVGISPTHLKELLIDFDFFFYMSDQLFLFTEEDIKLYRYQNRKWKLL
jgi:hypothetical protein